MAANCALRRSSLGVHARRSSRRCGSRGPSATCRRSPSGAVRTPLVPVWLLTTSSRPLGEALGRPDRRRAASRTLVQSVVERRRELGLVERELAGLGVLGRCAAGGLGHGDADVGEARRGRGRRRLCVIGPAQRDEHRRSGRCRRTACPSSGRWSSSASVTRFSVSSRARRGDDGVVGVDERLDLLDGVLVDGRRVDRDRHGLAVTPLSVSRTPGIAFSTCWSATRAHGARRRAVERVERRAGARVGAVLGQRAPAPARSCRPRSSSPGRSCARRGRCARCRRRP